MGSFFIYKIVCIQYANPLVQYIFIAVLGWGWVGTMCATMVFTVFENIKTSDPWTNAKLNSITHKKKFFNVLSFFELVWLIRSANMTP